MRRGFGGRRVEHGDDHGGGEEEDREGEGEGEGKERKEGKYIILFEWEIGEVSAWGLLKAVVSGHWQVVCSVCDRFAFHSTPLQNHTLTGYSFDRIYAFRI